jgi:hypothetical protein
MRGKTNFECNNGCTYPKNAVVRGGVEDPGSQHVAGRGSPVERSIELPEESERSDYVR